MRKRIQVELIAAALCLMSMLPCSASQRLSPPSESQPAAPQVDPAQAQWEQLVAKWEEQLKLLKEQLKIEEIQKLVGQMDKIVRSTEMVKQELSLLQKTSYGTTEVEEAFASLLLKIYTQYGIQASQCRLR